MKTKQTFKQTINDQKIKKLTLETDPKEKQIKESPETYFKTTEINDNDKMKNSDGE